MLADTNAALPVQGAGIFGRKKSENMYEMSGVDRLKMWRLIHILEFLTSIQVSPSFCISSLVNFFISLKWLRLF